MLRKLPAKFLRAPLLRSQSHFQLHAIKHPTTCKSISRPLFIGFPSFFKLKKPEIKPYKFNSTDYIKLLNPKVGFCEIQGNRETQEDILVTHEHETGIETIPPKLIKSIFENTISQMQKKFGNEPNQGSTLCNVTAWLDTNRMLSTHTAYVGDSCGYLIVIDEHNAVKMAVRLNKNLHNPENHGRLSFNDPNEISFECNLGSIGSKSLALNRSIGDTDFEEVGLSHEPEIDELTVSIAPTHKAYIIVACDGLTEGMLDLNGIGMIVARNSHNSPDGIAQQLVLSAHNQGSDDNISVAVILVDSERPISAAVFDGHGGSKVSEHLGNAFYPELQKQIDKVMAENTKNMGSEDQKHSLRR